MDDQSKFINSYINNLAERLKGLTLDNVMLNTQLAIANEKVKEIEQKLHVLEHEAEQRKETIKALIEKNGGAEVFETEEGYSVPEQEDASLAL